MKEFKNSIQEMIDSGQIKFVPIDWEQHYKDQEKQKVERKKLEEETRIKEKERFDNIKCPVCGSKEKDWVRKSKSNNIIGPGSRSWITEEYIFCTDCGVMYKDINKDGQKT